MSLQFVLGNSGCGKSYYLYRHLVDEAQLHPEKVYMLLVPEQFTVQTERELVRLASDSVIMNIEVLSFQRLAYRVFEELGISTLDVLEETGKNLVLRRVSEQKDSELTFLSGKMTKQGFITELRSLISELTQYRISPDMLPDMGRVEGASSGFVTKMKDLEILYRGFREYIKDRYITAEEVLELLEEVLPESNLLSGAVIAFDGYTGFTPNQKAVLYRLFLKADCILSSVTIDEGEDFFQLGGEEELFSMPKEMIDDLVSLARKSGTEIMDPIILPAKSGHRYIQGGKLSFLEQNLFRNRKVNFHGESEDQIQIMSCMNPRAELHRAAASIRKLVQEGQLRYRDIALVTPALDEYKEYAASIFREYGIPLYLDVRTTPSDHPLMELIRGLFEVQIRDYSYQSIMKLLRSGIPILPMEDVDFLDNYLIASGARGYQAYSNPFPYKPRGFSEEDLLRIEQIRSELMENLNPFTEAVLHANGDVRALATALYYFLDRIECEQYIHERADELDDLNLEQTAFVYRNVFSKVMRILDKMVELLDGDDIGPKEFLEILDAGVDTLKIGTIPESNDTVVMGDLERTRLNDIKALFVLGVCDAWIPKSESKGGILSDFERELLYENAFELSATSRKRAFRQKYYLYSVLTKPSQLLHISFCRQYSDGKSAHPAFLVDEIKSLFPDLCVLTEEIPDAGDILTKESLLRLTGEYLREERAVPGSVLSDEKKKEILREMLIYLQENDKGLLQDILSGAFYYHDAEMLSNELKEDLAGTKLDGSVSKLELFAKCPYAYFLQYGLKLHEREEYTLNDMEEGSLYHDVLNIYSQLLIQSGTQWGKVSMEDSKSYLDQALQAVIDEQYVRRVFHDARSNHHLERIRESMNETVEILNDHARRGTFLPKRFEYDLTEYENLGDHTHLSALEFPLKNGSTLYLKGRVDRIDTMDKDGTLYIRIVDYKSGSSEILDPNKTAAGVELQLLLYMNAVLEGEARLGQATAPAEILYYHLRETMLGERDKVPKDASEQDLKNLLLKKYASDALVNSDEEIKLALDNPELASSKVQDTMPKKQMHLSEKQFRGLLSTVKKIVGEKAEEIEEGRIQAKPYRSKDESACTYCKYHSICGYDANLPGFEENKSGNQNTWEGLANAGMDE